MPKTEVRSAQIKDATVGRSDINIATPGEAIVAKIVAGTNITISSTGADTGTGDVTINAAGGGGGGDVFKNQANVFTRKQTIQSSISGDTRLSLIDTFASTNQGKWDIIDFNSVIQLVPLNDDGSGLPPVPITFYRDSKMLIPSELTVGQNSLVTGGNVARIDAVNIFSQDQKIIKNTPIFTIKNANGGIHTKTWYITAETSTLIFQSISDTGAWQSNPLVLGTYGDVTVGRSLTVNNASGNVALKTAQNTFISNQTISNVTGGDNAARLNFYDSTQPSGVRAFQLAGYSQVISFFAMDDTFTSASVNACTINRGGDITAGRYVYEQNRAYPIGYWIPHTLTLTAVSGTATIGTVFKCAYMLVGKTCTLTFYFTMTVTGSPGFIDITLPSGIVNVSEYNASPFCISAGTGAIIGAPYTGTISLYREVSGLSPWGPGSYTCAGTHSFQFV